MIPTFSNNPSKFIWREENIIKPARSFFGQNLPKDLQYISMSSKCATNGILDNASEADQLYKSGLVTPNQFYGVEIDKKLHQHNVNAPGNWVNKDFVSFIRHLGREGKLRPGIINLDTMHMPSAGAKIASNIFGIISHIDNNIMFVINLILKHYRHKKIYTGDDIITELKKHNSFRFNAKKWIMPQTYYEYPGVNKNSNVLLGTVVFYKV